MGCCVVGLLKSARWPARGVAASGSFWILRRASDTWGFLAIDLGVELWFIISSHHRRSNPAMS